MPADARYVFNTEAGLTASVALYLTAFRYVCGLLSCWDRPRWQRVFGALAADLIRPRSPSLAVVPATIAVTSAILIGMFVTGRVAVNTTHVAMGENAETPIWLSLLLTALPTIMMLSMIIAVSGRGSIASRLLAVGSMMLCLMFSFASGRRTFLFTLLLGLATWLWLRPRNIRPRLILTFAICGVPLLFAASTLFQAARLAQADVSAYIAQPSLLDVLLSDSFLARLPVAAAHAWSDFAARAYSISFFVDIFERMTPDQAMMGSLFAFSGPLRTIPSLVWPDKIRVLGDYGSPEVPVQRHLMLLETDQAMPIAIIGYVDWWIFGAAIAPLIVLAISFAFAVLASWSRLVVPRLAALSSAIIMAWNAEFEFAAAFVYLRFALIAFLTFAILDAVLLRHAGQPAAREPSR